MPMVVHFIRAFTQFLGAVVVCHFRACVRRPCGEDRSPQDAQNATCMNSATQQRITASGT